MFKEIKNITKNDYFGVPVIKDEIEFYTNDLDFWYMLGMYLGDGWLSKKGNDIIISCNENKLQKLKDNLPIEKYKYTYSWNGSCYRLRFSNKEIKKFIEKYIKSGSSDKVVPIEILNLPEEQLEKFYCGYLDSDGCKIENNYQFTSVNRNIIYMMGMIVNKLYHTPTKIYKTITKDKHIIQKRIVNQKNTYMLRFKKGKNKQDKAFYENGYIWYPFNKITKGEVENVYNMEIENDHSYIVQNCISKNCQDLSLAGKRKGMSKDNNTRSGMLWEVERILDECNDIGNLPQILLMENVPEVIGKDNVEYFNQWQHKLETLGYKNYHQILNGIDYGIPQTRRRCFMVSTLGDYVYNFPQKQELKLKLKDMLETDVDEKYFLSDKQINDIQNWNAYEKPLENMEKIDKSNLSPTITTRSGAYASGMILIKNKKLNILGNYMPSNHNASNIYDSEYCSPTITTGNHGLGTTIAIKNATEKGYLEAKDGDGIDISSRMKYHRGTVQKDKSQTLTTSINVGVVVKDDYIGTYQYSKSDNFMQGKSRFKENKEVSDTLLTSPKEGIVNSNLRIRKLTPLEVFRLMGVKDEDYENCAKNQSNASLYHLAGDSIIVNVLCEIFKEVL